MAVDNDERTLYVSNLDRNVTDELLFELFLQAGPVEKVYLPPNVSYGFVTYKHACSVDYAIKLYEGTELFRKELNIRKRSERSQKQDHYQGSDYGMSDYQVMRNENRYAQNSLKGQWSGHHHRPASYSRDGDSRSYGRSRDKRDRDRHNNSYNYNRGRY